MQVCNSVSVATHSKKPPTVLKESADLVILGVTFDAKMTFEKPFALFPVLQLRGLVL